MKIEILELLTIYRRKYLANYLGVSIRTLENWAQGRNEPNPTAKKLIEQLLTKKI